MSEVPKAVFLSYASQDAEAVRRMAEALRASGVELWFDADGGLEHGDEWDAKIRRQIKECVLFIPVISAATQAREEGYFRLEWDLAAERARTIASGVPFILPVVIDDTREPDALVPDRFRTVQWTKLRGGEVPTEVQQRFLKLWSHRTGVLKNEATQASAPAVHTAPPAAESIGKPRAKNYALIAAVIAVIFVGAGWWLLGGRTKSSAPVAAPVASRAAPAAEFPRDPDLKRVYKLLYNVVDGIAEDFALMDDLVKPLLAARPNDPEVVTVAAELAQEFVTRGFDASPSRRAQAQKLTERAVQLAPENPEALATLGFYLYSTKTQLGRAEELLRRAIELNPKEPRFYCFLYRVLTASNKPAAEIDAFGVRMAELFPDYPMVGYSISGHFADLSNFAAADEWLDKSLALASVPYAIVAKAKMMLEVHGDIDGMKRWLERMPERQRTNAGLMNAYVVLATVSGQTGPARRLLESIGDTWLADGTYTFPKALLAGELDQLDGHDDIARIQFEAAHKEVQARLAADPTDLRPMRAAMWVQLGLGHRDQARAALQINLQLRPTPYHWTLNLTWWTSALRACLLLDERAQAITLLREACAESTGRLLLRNLFHVDPKMAPFRDDPEIVALLAEPKKETTASSAPSLSNGPAPAVYAKSVAVLAFANLSDDKGNEYFSDGIADELLTVLQKIPGLRVAARTSAFSFKGKSATAKEVGEKLGMAHVVEGSVQKSGNRVKITARLSRAATNEEIWSESYGPLELTDVFATQSEIAQKIVAQLRGPLTGGDPAKAKTEILAQVRAAQRGGTAHAAAHDAYLQGRFYQSRDLVENLGRPVAHFRHAVELDPGFALGWAALSQALGAKASLAPTVAEIGEGFAAARRAADRALAIEPNLAEGLAARMLIQLNHDFDWQGARKSLQQARAAEPLEPAMLIYALGLEDIFGESDPNTQVEEVRRALTLDPLNPNLRNLLALRYLVAGHFVEAEAEYRRLIEISPQGSWGFLASVLNQRGRYDEAAATAEKETVEWLRLTELAQAYWGQNNPAAADAALKKLIAIYGEQCGIQIAHVYAFRGELDLAFAWLDRAYLQRDTGLPGIKTFQSDPTLRRLFADPRWPAFLRKLGLADDQLK